MLAGLFLMHIRSAGQEITYHQELKAAHTESGICQTVTATCCYPGLAAGSNIGLTNA